LWLVARVQRLSREVGGQNWSVVDSRRILVVTSQKRQIVLPGFKSPFNFHEFGFKLKVSHPRSGPPLNDGLFYDPLITAEGSRRDIAAADGNSPPAEKISGAKYRPYFIRFHDEPAKENVRLGAGQYRAVGMLVGEAPAAAPVNDLQSLALIGGQMSNFAQASLILRSEERRFNASRTTAGHPFSDWGPADEPDDAQRNFNEQPLFEVKATSPNIVTLAIPPQLAEHIRKFRKWAN
jgi:hypothetical protein